MPPNTPETTIHLAESWVERAGGTGTGMDTGTFMVTNTGTSTGMGIRPNTRGTEAGRRRPDMVRSGRGQVCTSDFYIQQSSHVVDV